MHSTIRALALGFTVGLAAAPAGAAQLTFFGEDLGLGEGTRLAATPNADAARANFLSNLIGVGTEDFESFANGATPPLAVVFPAAGTATLTGDGAIANVPTGTNGFGRYPISGDQFYEVTGEFVITFSDPVAAFGFYGIDIGDFDGQLTVTYANGVTTDLVVPNSTNIAGGSVLYFGLIDTVNLFTSVTFGNTNAGIDLFGFDDFTIGSLEQVREVPAPAALALFGIGLLGLGFARRRG